MARRAGIFALLLFQAMWLAVILPGHTRGVVTLPGFEPLKTCAGEASSAHGCCPGQPDPSREPPSGDPRPGDGRAANCAVCFFAARLSLPVTIDLTPAALELLERRDVPQSEHAISLDPRPTYLGRAPPQA